MTWIINNMGFQTTFDVLSTLVGNQKSRGRSVRNVDATTDGSTLRVTMELLVPLRSASTDETERGLTVETTELTDEGGLAVELAVPELVPLPASPEPTVEVTGRTVEVTREALSVDLDLAIEPPDADAGGAEGRDADDIVTDGNGEPLIEHGRHDAVSDAVSDAEPVDGLEAIRDESVPPYEDVEYLRTLYAECDTFSEMRDAIAMDVSAETVRRYMIDAGIHEPTAYETATADTRTGQRPEDGPSDRDEPSPESSPSESPPAESPHGESSTDEDSRRSVPDAQLVADGLGLPDNLEIADVIDAVVRSSTVYEVKRELGLNDGYARELLKQLNLLDLVMCRLSRAPEREVTYEEAVDRVRRCTAVSG